MKNRKIPSERTVGDLNWTERLGSHFIVLFWLKYKASNGSSVSLLLFAFKCSNTFGFSLNNYDSEWERWKKKEIKGKKKKQGERGMWNVSISEKYLITSEAIRGCYRLQLSFVSKSAACNRTHHWPYLVEPKANERTIAVNENKSIASISENTSTNFVIEVFYYTCFGSAFTFRLYSKWYCNRTRSDFSL